MAVTFANARILSGFVRISSRVVLISLRSFRVFQPAPRPALLVMLLAFALPGCGSSPPQAPPAEETPAAEVSDIASADPQVKYFHEQLVINGEELQTDFGSYLTALDLSPRDLQQDDPQHAYDTVLEKVRKVEDPALRGEMMRTFFNRAE